MARKRRASCVSHQDAAAIYARHRQDNPDLRATPVEPGPDAEAAARIAAGPQFRVVETPPQAGDHPPFPAPWYVLSGTNDAGNTSYSVHARDGRIVIQPGEHGAFCHAVVRSRNEGTDAETIAFLEARHRRALENLRAEVEAVRACFRAQLDRVETTNARLQDAIVAARASGSVADLPAWCQPSDEYEQAMMSPSGGKRRR